jgi:hypothetical protein
MRKDSGEIRPRFLSCEPVKRILERVELYDRTGGDITIGDTDVSHLGLVERVGRDLNR